MRSKHIVFWLSFAPSKSRALTLGSSAITPSRRVQRASSYWPLKSSATQDLYSLTVVELKGLLKTQGCKVTGRKAELIERLEESYAVSNTADGNAIDLESDDVTSSPTSNGNNKPIQSLANDLARLTVPQLKQLLKAQGCTVSGSKDDLIQRLAAVVAEHREQKDSSNERPSITFADMNIPGSIQRRLREIGFEEPTPIQRDAIPIALDGIDVMGLAQTGTGKTLAFGIPLVSKLLDGGENDARGKNALLPKSVSALVLAPTRELANQIAEELANLTEGTPVKTYVVYGGVKISTQANRLENGVHILVATPGRLVDLMHRGEVSLKSTRFFVLDESDMMCEFGFAPDLKKIANELPMTRQTMMFSATMSREMAEVAKFYLKDPVRVEVARAGMTADKITQEVHFVTKMDKMTKLTSLMNGHKGERTLIFGRTKHGMQKLSDRLNHVGIKAISIHGNKSQSQRDRAIREFKSGEVKVLVATDVAARGLDIPEVKHVYNYELPDQAENYVHRVGRTARAGNDGSSISFCSPEEMNDLAAIEGLIGISIPVASGTPWERQRSNQRRRSGFFRQNNTRRVRR